MRREVLLCFICVAAPTWAAAPVLYSEPAHQSPVRGDPDDLLLLPGSALSASDTVVYRRGTSLDPPDSATDVAPIVSASSAPNSLTIRLPEGMARDRAHVLWVRNRNDEWSNGIRINDPRPLWITPDHAFHTASVASLPRELKIVGRNLNRVTRVRLIGATTLVPAAVRADRYVVRIGLPTHMPIGQYTVEVREEEGGWVRLEGQRLSVRQDPLPPADFLLEARGGCRANDHRDDTPCIVAAIEAARAAGGGRVIVGPGTWIMANSGMPGVTPDGIPIPPAVSLIGSGADTTTLSRAASWGMHRPSFALQGDNEVRGIRFVDQRRYESRDAGRPLLQLGMSWQRSPLSETVHVTITQNVFDKPFIAIGDAGLPIRGLFVTHNEIGAYHTGLFPGGDSRNLAQPFRIEDSVIAHNVFMPGSYLDLPARQGTIASQIGAGRRLDFSDNVAEGTSTKYLYDPQSDAKGWRAGFFWHMNGSHERVLVSNNTATCTGDKTGDGEAIVFDNNHNMAALEAASPIVAVTPDSVTIRGPLLTSLADRWVQIAKGPGIGQVRRIVAYEDRFGTVTLEVSPHWDVMPDPANSEVTIAREVWQAYIVGNVIDHRRPTCLKSNRYRPKGGNIGLTAQMADSVVEGNRQYDTDGIFVQHHYSTGASGAETIFQAFIEIRANVIEGEYDWPSDCSQSGIQLRYGAAADSPPPTLGYGESIAHNRITRADALRGGAISFPLAWKNGPAPHRWPLIDNTLVFHNFIQDVTGPVPPRTECDGGLAARVGIHLHDSLVWRTVLYRNASHNVTFPVNDRGSYTRAVTQP